MIIISHNGIVTMDSDEGFTMESLSRKFTKLTGLQPNTYGVSNIHEVEKVCTKVVVPDIIMGPSGKEMRAWCQQNFGDDWIYTFNEFYFKDPKNATIFSLRWL